MTCGQGGVLASACYTARTILKSAAIQPESAPPTAEVSIVTVLATVLWLGCLLVGGLGFVLPYARPRPIAPPAPPLHAQLVRVELTAAPAPSPLPVQLSPADAAQPPPLPALAPLPPAPQLVAVARPSAAIAFAQPVEAPARIVAVKPVALVRPAPPAVQPTAPDHASASQGDARPSPAPAPAVQTLTFGQGEGRQPAPQYPDAARRAGHEGTVVVRFNVGQDGRVLAAEPSSPSPWSTLNREALRVVREEWRFPPGPARLFEVAIRFELRK